MNSLYGKGQSEANLKGTFRSPSDQNLFYYPYTKHSIERIDAENIVHGSRRGLNFSHKAKLSPWKLKKSVDPEVLKKEEEWLDYEDPNRHFPKTRLDGCLPVLDNPGPGRYNVSGTLLKPSINRKAGCNLFSRTGRFDALGKTNTNNKSHNDSKKFPFDKDNENKLDKLRSKGSLTAILNNSTTGSVTAGKISNEEPSRGSNKAVRNSVIPLQIPQYVNTFERGWRLPPANGNLKKIKISKEGRDNGNFGSEVRIKTKELGDLANTYEINKFFLASFSKKSHQT